MTHPPAAIPVNGRLQSDARVGLDREVASHGCHGHLMLIRPKEEEEPKAGSSWKQLSGVFLASGIHPNPSLSGKLRPLH